jgi:hypothetical protein
LGKSGQLLEFGFALTLEDLPEDAGEHLGAGLGIFVPIRARDRERHPCPFDGINHDWDQAQALYLGQRSPAVRRVHDIANHFARASPGLIGKLWHIC